MKKGALASNDQVPQQNPNPTSSSPVKRKEEKSANPIPANDDDDFWKVDEDKGGIGKGGEAGKFDKSIKKKEYF